MDSQSQLPPPLRADFDAQQLLPVFADLGLEASAARGLLEPGEDGQAPCLGTALESGRQPRKKTLDALLSMVNRALHGEGAFFLFLEGERTQRQLAAWRNGLWPLLHASAIYRVSDCRFRRQTLSGVLDLECGAKGSRDGSLIFFRRRAHAMGPDATIEKFDQNAAGWNGAPGSANYPHFRWMRRFVACFAKLPAAERILDFGCGAGWCGIEAAKHYGAKQLAFFDPSPEMVKIAERNAREQGIAKATGRTGFGEEPPFPVAGQDAFDLVISSGVISFAPQPAAWIEGLKSTVKVGGTLVIGDIQRTSRGMQRRRREKALLPARELNASTAQEVQHLLEERGFECLGGAGYQLTRPFPEAMHVNETKMNGLLSYPLLWSNQLAAAGNRAIGVPGPDQFDSWVMALLRRE